MGQATLTKQEQANVRVALRALSVSNGGIALLAARMEVSYEYLRKVLYGVAPAGVTTAIRVARMAGATIDGVLSGAYPGPGVCRHCGHAATDAIETEGSDVH